MVTTATNTVSVAFANNPTGATLGGTRSVTASGGVATFSGSHDQQDGLRLHAPAPSSGLSSAVTSPINVTKTGKDPIPLSARLPAAPARARHAPRAAGVRQPRTRVWSWI